MTVGALAGRVHRDARPHRRSHLLFFPADKLAFVGDTLFSIGCGRVIEGTPEMMWQSLLKLRALPDDTQILLRPRIHRRPTSASPRPSSRTTRRSPRAPTRSTRLLAARQADDPGDHRRGEGGQSVPARRRAGGRAVRRPGRQPGRGGVRRNPRAQRTSSEVLRSASIERAREHRCAA